MQHTALSLSLSLSLCISHSFIFSALGHQSLFQHILLNMIKKECLLCLTISSFLHFPEVAALVATSLGEDQVTVNHFAVESKAFGINTNLKKKVVIHQLPRIQNRFGVPVSLDQSINSQTLL